MTITEARDMIFNASKVTIIPRLFPVAYSVLLIFLACMVTSVSACFSRPFHSFTAKMTRMDWSIVNKYVLMNGIEEDKVIMNQ